MGARRSWTIRVVLAMVLVKAAAATTVAQMLDRPARPAWALLEVPDPVGNLIARRALDNAWERLGRQDCAANLVAFAAEAGHPVRDPLAALSVDLQTYLTMVKFIDGTRERACRAGVFAFTQPGSRVVRLCVEELKRMMALDPDFMTARLIHEMLHSLGLGENPPSSSDITKAVLAACPRQRR
jgi:hypothetical protein